MNLALSNFAWDEQNQHEVLEFLSKNNVNKIECIFTKFISWDNIDDKILKNYTSELLKYKITPYSVQSIFYETNFSDFSDEIGIINHFKKIISICEKLKIKIIVFGSPKLRKIFYGWYNSYVNIFKEVDNLLKMTDIHLVIEPNSRFYGGDFFFSVYEIVDFIKKNNFTNVTTMIDTHNLILDGDDPIESLSENIEFISHIHISETKLQTINNFEFHEKFSKKIKDLNYNKVITYEVLKCENIISSINDFISIYK